MLAKETVCEIVELNEFKHRMFNLRKSAPYHTYRELDQASDDIGEKIIAIKNFLKLKDEHWSLEMAYAGIEFSKGEQYKQLRACGTEYIPYYRILTDLLITRNNIKEYIEKKYTHSMINKEKAQNIMNDLQKYYDANIWVDTQSELYPIREVLSLLHDVMESTGE